MNYYSSIAHLLTAVEQAIPKDQYFELTKAAEESIFACNLTATFINEMALECNFSEVEDGANKLAQINITLSELALVLTNINSRRSDLKPSVHSQIGG